MIDFDFHIHSNYLSCAEKHNSLIILWGDRHYVTEGAYFKMISILNAIDESIKNFWRIKK